MRRLSKTFGNKNSLRQHRRNVHKYPAYMFIIECGECQRMDISDALIEQHFRKKHGPSWKKYVFCVPEIESPVPEKV